MKQPREGKKGEMKQGVKGEKTWTTTGGVGAHESLRQPPSGRRIGLEMEKREEAKRCSRSRELIVSSRHEGNI